jgi:kinesin family protein 6/9
MSTSVTRKTLNLDDKVKAINLCDGGKIYRAVAEEMGVGRTQIMNILKRKSEILDDFKNNMPGSRKLQRRVTGNEDINQLCWDWFQEATGRRITISGPLIQEQALTFAKDVGVDQFKVSNGWLQSFLKRHNIVFRTLSGESDDVYVTIVSEWK